MSEYTKGDQPMRAIGSNVMIVEDAMPEATKGGILLPEMTKQIQLMATGTVVHVGAYYYEAVAEREGTAEVNIGDKVLFIKTQAHQYKHEDSGKTFHFVPVGNLVAVFND